ncbi:MAG: PaaI family thioesterase [Planctomycetes bacterium]|nr:PaaI family thioesterase [Planctomycetota bacterium]
MSGFNAALGLKREGGGTIVLETRPEHEVAVGIIHFAVLATLAEVAAAEAVGEAVVPASVSLNLLQRAAPGKLIAKGRLLRKGRRLAVAEGEVFSGDAFVAKAIVTFAIG